MFSKNQSQKLEKNEVLGESGVLTNFEFLFRTVALHFSEEGFDYLRDQKVQTSKDESNDKTNENLLFVGKEKIFKERV